MPFTIAHPAAVIPLERRLGTRVSLSALVIGSMVPDFAYFLPFWVTRADTHTVAALVWFSLPVGCATYAIFHLFVKQPLLAVWPGVAARLRAGSPGLPAASWLVVATSVLVGAATHVTWDAFTHEGTTVVHAFPFLGAELFTVGGYHVYVFKLLQHGSTVLGVGYLARRLSRWWRTAEVRSVPPAQVDVARTIAIALLVVLPVALGVASFSANASSSLTLAIGRAAKGALTGVGAAMLLFAVLWHLWLSKAATRDG